MPEPLSSPDSYQAFIYALPQQFAGIRHSTLVYVPSGELFVRVEGFLVFDQNVVLCVYEYLNFELGIIEGYGYDVSRAHVSPIAAELPHAGQYCQAQYPDKDKLYWYDSFPHPNDSSLASTDPHHKHVHPNIKHHRVPAPELSFTKPNLPFLIAEVWDLPGR